jgi:hypothetical protein
MWGEPPMMKELASDGKLKGRKLARRWYTTAEEIRDYFSRSEAEALQGGV